MTLDGEPTGSRPYLIDQDVLYAQWEGPLAVVDIDTPGPWHRDRETVTAQSKEDALTRMRGISCYDSTRMCIRVYETAGGLRGYITSHKISATHLWKHRRFAQHLLDQGSDPNNLICCMALCKFGARISPKWHKGNPRENDTITLIETINPDIPELPDLTHFVNQLEALQAQFNALGTEALTSALRQFRSQNSEYFSNQAQVNPWKMMRGIYRFPHGAKTPENRVLVRDLQRWTRRAPVPEPPFPFLSI